MPKLALSMIVRNAAETLRACLGSVRGIADEIVVADTGSTDATIAIAREFGARVIKIPWENDFAAARNRALAEVRSDWVLILDADEVLDAGAIDTISRLMDEPNVAGYQVPIRNYVRSLEDRIWDRPAKPNDFLLPAAHGFPAYVEHENVRLFRRDPEIYFVGRVHETVGTRIEQRGLRLGHAPFLIHHFGLADDRETRAQKNRFYRELGKLKAAEMPSDAQAHLELGLVELDNFGNLEEALSCFERACELNPRFGVAWFFAGIAHFRLGQNRESLRCLQRAEELGRVTPAILETTGDAHYNLGEFPEALRAYERALEQVEGSAMLKGKQGLAMVRAGQTAKGLETIRNAVQREPRNAELHDRLILSLVWLDRVPEAALAAEGKLRSVATPNAGDFARSASLWAKLGNWARATAVLHVGLRVFKDDPGLKLALEQLAVDSGTLVDDLVATLNQSGSMSSGR